MDTKGKVKKKPRRLPKREDDDERPLSPQSDQNTSQDQTEARFDKLLLAAMQQTTDEKRKSGKKKGKKTRSQTSDAMLESLKQGADLRKDTDPSLDPSVLANTYDSSNSPRFSKNMTNERRRKLPPKKGVENKGFLDDDQKEVPAETPKKTKKKKKQADATDIIDSGPLTMQELEDTPKKVRRKKKSVTRDEGGDENENTAQERAEDEVDGGEPGKELDEEGNEDEEKKVTKKKKKKKQMASADDNIEGDENAEVESIKKKKKRKKLPKDDGRVLGVTVHRSDRLKTDLYIAHPVVRVHIIDAETGTYFKKSKSDRAVTSYYENQNDKVDYILPVLTQPYDFKKRKSIIPCWDEQLIFNENYLYLVQTEESAPKTVIFFEILDFVSMNVAAAKVKTLKGEGGWHRIAWAFLKVVGANGSLNTDKKVRLQLFHPPFSYKARPGKLDVYQWWLNLSRQPYPSTLYITVKAVKTPDKVEPAVRSLFATQEEQGRMTYNDLQKSMNWGIKQGMSKDKKPPTNWSRLPGQMCRIPNKLSLTLAGDKKGCFVIKFSPSGRFLACGCKDREGYPVLVYEIPSGRFKCKFPGHYSLIYDICWSPNDREILTASSDGTARVWSLDTPGGAAVTVFPHPAFVYTAKFHPQADRLVVSGGYDHVIRVWNLKDDVQMGELLQELDGHKGFVNCLCFSRDGKTMYSGDSMGVIIKWNAAVMAKAATSGAPDTWSLEKVITEKELDGVTINALEVHPSGRRLLIHGRDNNLRMMDLRLFTVMQRYLGALNFREHIRSTMTECGSFIISGSEDCQAYVWSTDTGDQIAAYSSLGYKYPVMAVAYHPHEHMVAFCSRGEGHPIQVYVYDTKVAQLDLGLKSMAAAGKEKEVQQGPNKAEESLVNILEAKKDLKDELDTTKTLRMERVKAKLATVMALKALEKESKEKSQGQQQLQQSMLGNSLLYPPGGSFPMQQTLSTWGSTFNTSVMKPPAQLTMSYRNQSMGVQLPTPTLAQLESPGMSSFLASQSARGVRSLGMSMGGTGWTPPRAYFPRASTPNISLQATSQGGPATFTFNPPSSQKKGIDHRRVVALYDYTAQRSDELSLRQGDWIAVLHEDNENWWMGQLADGHQGYFPANYVADEHLQEEGEEPLAEELGADGSYDDVLGSTGVDEIDAGTTPQRKTKAKPKKSRTKMTAVVDKRGELKIISGAEDSDLDSTAPGSSTRRKKKRTLSRELAIDASGNNTTDADTTPRRRPPRARSQSSQRRLAASFDTVDAGIPPKPRKKRSKTADEVPLPTNGDPAGSSAVASPRRTRPRDPLLSGGSDVDDARTPKPRKRRPKTSEENGEPSGGPRRATPQLAKTLSKERLLAASEEEGEPRTPTAKKGGKRKQKTNHTERTV